ncbi:hypothetical protein ACR6C2_07745 [Streptomyces sp. INA 01156]
MRQGRDGRWQLRAVLTVPVPGHSSPLYASMAAFHAMVERSNLALAASAAGLLAAPDAPSGHRPDVRSNDVRTVSAGPTGTPADLPGQRPDAVSGQVDAEALAAALARGPLIDLIADAVTQRQDERRAEIEAMAALVAQQPATTIVAAQDGVI